ncbi:MAG: DNA methyltransferase [Chloroflexota bacterium]|nr:DNA methyltransferase [Chloroflexota bacterium]
MAKNTLYYGDNLDILRRYIKDESVDLIYLDPPFNSQATYNVLFGEQNGTQSPAQIQAFDDTWHWDEGSARAYREVVERGGRVSRAMQAFRKLLGCNDMLAYLAMMAPRLVELRRVLKPTGSIYLHCDPTASHYLKILMDAVFGVRNFRNEIIWKRQSAHSDATRYGSVHDTILFYSKSEDAIWNKVYQPYDEEYVDKYYRYIDDDGRRFMSSDLSAAGLSGGGYEYEWNGITRVWRCPIETMEQYERDNRIYYTRNGFPRYKRYLDEMPGLPAQDIWDDIESLRSWHKERLGYPTQKPEALLERIIEASSNDGDLVLDPFCGCGTAVAVAEQLDRRWIGIDITHLAIGLMKHRLRDTFGDDVEYEVIGEPVSLPGAKALAESDPYQFQWWALGLVGARPVEQKKGADKGIDGRLYFHDDAKGDTKQVIISVKAGHTGVAHVRDLRGVVDREDAEIGVVITMQEPTGPALQEAASAGFYHSPGWNTDHPRLQILTVTELLEGKGIDMPPLRQVSQTFKQAPPSERESGATQGKLDL